MTTKEKILFASLAFLIVCQIAWGIAFFQMREHMKAVSKKCYQTANDFERERHSPYDDGSVTNLDILAYMKTTQHCFFENL